MITSESNLEEDTTLSVKNVCRFVFKFGINCAQDKD